ncbi:MAG: carotenoid oxygenase family protein [Gammaproteobacteria bacterium]|nr:carotenoid oxygenase family protein [Gammaproteobacteria bacterium]
MHAQIQTLSRRTAASADQSCRLPSLGHEHDFQALAIEGSLPADLRGTLYRNGPARYDIGTRAHWFDGRGAVSAVRFDGQGGASGAVRLTHTPTVDADLAAATPRFGGFRQPSSWGRSLAGLFGGQVVRNLANINVLPWQGRLFALFETTLPVELDPATLENLGETSLAGLVGAWNAHPHRVASRRAVYQFGVRIGREVSLEVYELPDSGAARRLTTLPLPGVGEVHDFFATDHHLVFMLAPLWCSPLELLARRSFVDALRWRADQPSQVLVIPIDRPHEVLRLETEPFFFWHSVNGHERAGGRELVLDLVRYPHFAATRDALAARSDGGPLPIGAGGSSLARAVLDLPARRVRWETLADRPCEFPAVASARQGAPCDSAWLATQAQPAARDGWFNGLTRFDLERGTSRDIGLGAHRSVSEPALVAKREGDGHWLLCLVADHEAGRSWLGVWDADGADDEPRARVWFDQLVPPPLHGCWMGARD